MALSPLRNAAFRRGCAAASRSASSCSSGISGMGGCGGRPLGNTIDNHRAASEPTMIALHRPFLGRALFSSAVRDGSNDASIASPSPGKPNTSDDANEREGSWSSYERMVRKLYMTNLYNPVKLGLENMDRLHKALGSPMDQPNISVVHIAGSNGKGSVALKTANALRLSGYKVGLFVSPHVSSFRERVQIDCRPISEDLAEAHLREIFEICERESIPATFFEVTTALAFRAFAEAGAEVVVLETGLGGRLDATNVVRRPALSVVTTISLEHTRILGDTVEEIAREKGGIIKEGCQVLVGDNVPLKVLERCAEERGASELFGCHDVLGPRGEAEEGTFEDYDAENSRMASAALILLQFHLAQRRIESGGEVKMIMPADIEEGVKIRPPCRFEEMDIPVTIATGDGTTAQKIVRVVLDIAHNPQAMDYLVAKLRASYPNSSDQRVVVGMSADKDLRRCTDVMLDHVSRRPDRLHLMEASHPRAASISSILEANPKLVESHHDAPPKDELNDDGRDASSVSRQVRRALELAALNDELLVVCGSVFVMADAREELGVVEPRDSAAIAEVAGAGLRSSQENFGAARGRGEGPETTAR